MPSLEITEQVSSKERHESSSGLPALSGILKTDVVGSVYPSDSIMKNVAIEERPKNGVNTEGGAPAITLQPRYKRWYFDVAIGSVCLTGADMGGAYCLVESESRTWNRCASSHARARG